jgi:hypothetical protein
VAQTIVTTTETGVNVPGFSALPAQQQTDLVNGATSIIQGYCGRTLVLTQHDETYAPENTRKLRLKQWPVVDIIRLCTGLMTAVTIRCTAAGASRATVKYTFTGQGDTLMVTGIQLSSVVGGVATNTPLLFSDYLTVQALADAVNALPGWAATVPANGSNPNLIPDFSGWATADLNPDLGAKGAIGTGAALWLYTRDLQLYDLNVNGAGNGQVILHEDLYQPFRFPDRTYTASGQFGHVRAIYLAGYNNDPGQGAITMPDALKRAAFILIQNAIQRTIVGLKTSEKTSLQAYEIKSDDITSNIADMIGNYRRRTLA